MPLIQTFVRPQVAERLFIELAASGYVQDLFAQEVQGSGSRMVGSSREIDILPKVLISGVVKEEFTENVIASIRALASMGRRGDGKILVFPLEPKGS